MKQKTNLKRPIGITILSILHFVGGALLIILLIYYAARLEKVSTELNSAEFNFPPAWALILGIAFLGSLSMVSGIGMWIGKPWGRWLGIFYYGYSILRNMNVILLIPAITNQVSASHGVGYYYIKFGGRIIISSLLILYFFKRNVKEYFGIQPNLKKKI